MTIQVSYPGVYIEETEPAAPIAGVSTSVAAFIGLAAQGPIGTPTFVSDLDDFAAKFGGPVVGAAPYYLPIAVDGFFRNGGTMAYILRMGTGKPAFAAITAASNVATKLATVEALLEGSAGDGGAIQVTHTSALGTALTTAGPTDALPATPSTTVGPVDATKLILTVGSTDGFEAGDDVAISKTAGGNPLSRTIASVDKAANTITLTSPLTAAAVNGIGIDIEADQSRLRLSMPPGVSQSLSSLIPPGSVVSVVDDDASPAWGVVAQVDSAGLVLTQPLGKIFRVAKNPKLRTLEFTIAITDGQNVTRTYAGLSTTPSHPQWWATAITDPYARVRLEKDANGAYVTITGADPRPAAGPKTPLAPAVPDNAAQSWLDVQNPAKVQAELDKLEPIDEISLVAVPGVVSPAVQQVVLTHCEQMADRFAVFDAPRVPDPPAILAHRLQLIGDDKGFAALYYPWITIFDPARNQVVPQPPSGHVVGLIARIDETRGVHKAPANAVIRGAIGVEVRVSDNQQKLLNPNGVNAIRILPGRAQPLVWGARTTAKNTNWQYINIRRLFLFLEESIQESLTGSVFEPNDLALWQKLKRTITEFLTRVWRDGALFGATAKEAFFVRIDDALNPPATRKLGRLYIEIGVQPVYPAEFIIVRIGIWDGGAEVAEL